PAKIGERFGELRVTSLSELATAVREYNVKLAIMAIPAEAAPDAAEKLAAAGIRGILNFAPTSLSLPPTVSVQSVDLAVQLEQLAFKMNLGEGAELIGD